MKEEIVFEQLLYSEDGEGSWFPPFCRNEMKRTDMKEGVKQRQNDSECKKSLRQKADRLGRGAVLVSVSVALHSTNWGCPHPLSSFPLEEFPLLFFQLWPY